MKKKYRLRKNEDFKHVYEKGKKYWNRNLILYKVKNNLDHSRVGFTVSKKMGNSVARNRVKRRLRDIYRKKIDIIDGGYDIIIIPKRNVREIEYIVLKDSVKHILKISGILKI